MFQKATTYAFNAEITFNLLLILFLLLIQKPTGTVFLRKQTNRGEFGLKYFLSSAWAYCLPRSDFFERSTDRTGRALCVKGVA